MNDKFCEIMLNSNKLYSLLGRGKTEDVLILLLKESTIFDKSSYDYLIQLSGRFNRAKESINLNKISREQFNTEISNIDSALLCFIKENLNDNKNKIYVEKYLSRKNIILLFCIIFPFLFSYFTTLLYPKKNNIVSEEPEIIDNIIKFRFHRFDIASEQDTFLFYFKLLDTIKFNIVPPMQNIQPDFLYHKSKYKYLSNDDKNERNKFENRQFNLSGVHDFGWNIRIKKRTNESIKNTDFKYWLCPPDYSNSNCAVSISKIDYLNIYPYLLPICIFIFWYTGLFTYLSLYNNKHKKI